MKSMGATFIAAALAALAVPGWAQPYPPGGWGGPYMGPMMPPPGPDYGPGYGARDSREGKIEAATFITSGPNVGALGHGPIVIAPAAGGIGGGLDDAVYESVLVDQLAKVGYRTDAPSTAGGQTIEYAVSRDVIQPPEPPHRPVGGEVAVGAGNRGSGVAIGLDIDLSKPLGALVATRLEARIRDSATRQLLWQGRASVITREGDRHWAAQALAARLSAALFKGFPRPTAIGGH